MSDNKVSLLEKFARKVKGIAAQGGSKGTASPDALSKAPEKNSVLIVDDEKHALDSLELQIEDQYRVYKADNGWDALDILRSNDEIGLAVIDMRMPKMDGLELARRMEKVRPVENIIRSAQIGRYGEAYLLNEIGPYVMVDKSPQGTQVLLSKIAEALKNFNLAGELIAVGSDESRDQRPALEEGQFHVPSIIGENVDFGEGRWIPVYPFFSSRVDNDRKPVGYCNITPYYALQCAYTWARERLHDWSNTPIMDRIERTVRTGERVASYVDRAETFHNGNGNDPLKAPHDDTGREEYLRLKFLAESGGFPLRLVYEGIRETARFMQHTEKIAHLIFQPYGVKLDSPFPTIMPRGIVGGVTRVTMPHTPEALTQPAAWTGNILLRRGDLYCPGMTHFFQEMMMKEGIPTQQFFSITKEDRYLATKFLHKLTNYFVFMGKLEKGIEIAYGDLIQYMYDSGQEERLPPLLKELQAPTGVGLFVAHEGFDYVWKTADIHKAARDNAHGGNCYIFSCKKTYLTGVDPSLAEEYIRLQMEETERLLAAGMILRPHGEYLEAVEAPYLDRLNIRDDSGRVTGRLGEIIYGKDDPSKPKLIRLDPRLKDTKEMIEFIGRECHSNVTAVMPIPPGDYLDMVERSARETQRSLKKGDVPRFLESNVHFDPDDVDGLRFYTEMVRRGIAYGSIPNMRTTHAFGDPASGLMGFHEGTTFAHVLTWAPNGILPNYEALKQAIPALGRLG